MGRNDRGNLGVAVETVARAEAPRLVSALGTVSQLAVGGFSTCGVVGTETRCVGDLPGVPSAEHGTSVSVPSLMGAEKLAIGGMEAASSGCALRADGSVACAALYDNLTNAPAIVPGGTFEWIALTHDSACALDTSGAVRCWGSEYDYDKKAYLVPTPKGAPPFRRLYGGSATYCGVTDAGEVHCWGRHGAEWNEAPAKLWP
jgi:hypothetical protein